MTKEKKHRMIERERVLAIALMVLAGVILAAAAGVTLALVDTHSGIGDLVYAITYSGADNTGPQAAEEVMAVEEQAAEEVNPTDAKDTVSDNETADATVSDNTISENTVSGNTVSDNAASDATISDNTVPAGTQTVSDNAAGVTDGTGIPGELPAATNATLPYPMGYQLVDASYFDDALFIGDSRMEGFGLHSGLNATFYAATGLQLHKIDTYKVVKTANGKVPIFSVLQPNTYKKIYIKVGLNELGWGTDEQFLQEYADLIARLRAAEPGAVIYIHGLIHVTDAKSQSDPIHTNEKINARNAMLQQFALQQQAYYIDINEVVSDANGALLPDMTSDGIHLKAQYMDLWKNYLMAHAVAVQ